MTTRRPGAGSSGCASTIAGAGAALVHAAFSFWQRARAAAAMAAARGWSMLSSASSAASANAGAVRAIRPSNTTHSSSATETAASMICSNRRPGHSHCRRRRLRPQPSARRSCRKDLQSGSSGSAQTPPRQRRFLGEANVESGTTQTPYYYTATVPQTAIRKLERTPPSFKRRSRPQRRSRDRVHDLHDPD